MSHLAAPGTAKGVVHQAATDDGIATYRMVVGMLEGRSTVVTTPEEPVIGATPAGGEVKPLVRLMRIGLASVPMRHFSPNSRLFSLMVSGMPSVTVVSGSPAR